MSTPKVHASSQRTNKALNEKAQKLPAMLGQHERDCCTPHDVQLHPNQQQGIQVFSENIHYAKKA
jgi:hypothetical protein